MKVPGKGKKALAGRRLSPAEGAGEELPVRARFLSASLLIPGEIVILEVKPSLWFAILAGAPVILLGLALVVLCFSPVDLPQQVRLWGVRLGMALAAVRIIMGMLQWVGQTYVLTDRRVLSQRGTLSVEVSEAPLSVITRTHIANSLVQRGLGIGTIFFSTDGGHRPPQPWEHVSRPAEVQAHIVRAIERYGRPPRTP
ncbi:MAG: PH domain-containing protein [Phycisphaerae bacterium]|nr:PH domain-containing protein [Phycisphaerae bacterium]